MALFLAVRLLWCSVYLLHQLKGQSDIQFLDLSKSLPSYLYRGMGAVYDDKLYAIHGATCSSSDGATCDLLSWFTFALDLSGIEFSGTNNKEIAFNNNPIWQTITISGDTFPSGSDGGYATAGSTYLGQYAYSIYPGTGQADASRFTMKYDLDTNAYVTRSSPEQDEWKEFPDTTDFYVESCNTNDGTYIYSIGGTTNSVSDQVVRLNVIANNNGENSDWEYLDSLVTPRRRASCTFISHSGGDYIYLLGGLDADNVRLDSIEQYTIDQDSWADFGLISGGVTMAVPRQQHVSYAHPNSEWIITLGGQGADSSITDIPIEIFDAVNRAVLATDIYYRQRFFYSTIYEYSCTRSL